VDIVHAPFQGFGPMIPALLGGQVPVGFITYSVSKGHLSSGKWKLIGVTNTEPNSKAMAMAGAQFVSDVVPGFEASPQWLGFGGPAGMPRPIVTRLNDAIKRALNEPAILERYIEDKQFNYGKVSLEEFERRVRDDYASVRKTVRDTGIPLQD
jgi:tripartite-type tricarboxylate transporter receptor subunit TctC